MLLQTFHYQYKVHYIPSEKAQLRITILREGRPIYRPSVSRPDLMAIASSPVRKVQFFNQDISCRFRITSVIIRKVTVYGDSAYYHIVTIYRMDCPKKENL